MDEDWNFARYDCKPNNNGINFFGIFTQLLFLCVFLDVMNYVYVSKKETHWISRNNFNVFDFFNKQF